MYNYYVQNCVRNSERTHLIAAREIIPSAESLELINSDYHHWSVLHNSQSHFQIIHKTSVGATVNDTYIRRYRARPSCVTLGHFLIARIRRVYYIPMYYMPYVRTYARAYKSTACYDTGPGSEIPAKFHRRDSRR